MTTLTIHRPSINAAELTVIIPAYNEEQGLGRTLDSLTSEPRLDGARIIVISDGSTDRTADIAREHGATVIENWSNLGYGASLKRGVHAATTRLIAWFDADGQHAPSDLADMLEHIEQTKAHAMIGARQPGSHVVRNRVVGKRLIKLAAELAMGRKIPDVNCGLRIFNRQILLRYLDLLPDGFSASTTSLLIFMKRNHHLVFHPITTTERVGKSSVKQIRDGFRALHTILRITVMFNAFRTFSWCAGVLIALGLSYGLTVGLMHGLGFPVFAALLTILGVQVFSMGVVCDQISAMRLERLGATSLDVDGVKEREALGKAA